MKKVKANRPATQLSSTLVAFRKRNFMTQTDLADKLGVSLVTVNRWERGLTTPTIKSAHKLDVSMKEIDRKGR